MKHLLIIHQIVTCNIFSYIFQVIFNYRYGNEDDLVTLFGVMQAIVSFVLDTDDEIQSIHTSNTHFTFLRKGNILLVSVSQVPADTELTTLQLK